MSGQTNGEQPDDLDDDFIIEDAPVNDLEDLFQAGPAAAKPKKGSEAPDASDVLFQAGDPADAQFEGRPEFAESSSGRWPGHELQPDDIGIPVEGREDPLTADDGIDTEQELEVIGDDGQVHAPAAGDESFVIDEGQIAGATGESDNPYITGEQPEVPVEEGWEPVAATPGRVADDEATLGTVDEEQAAEAEQEPALVGAGGGEEIYAEAQAEPAGRLVGAPQRRHRLFALLPSAAAASVVLAAGTVVVLRPEWLGLHFQPQLVERVQVARPAVEVRVPKPPMPAAGAVGTSPVPKPVDVQPQPSDPGPENHVPQPGNPSDNPPTPTTDPTPPPTQVGKAGSGRMLPVGENLLVGDFTPRSDTDTSWLNVKLGTKAFAQLRNGNFFVGSVKAVSANAVVLHVGSSDATTQKTTSEVTLPRTEVERITALDSQEYQELQQATTGSLRLTNNNRLVGTILKSVADDFYVLQMRSDRIVVPKKTAKLITSNNEQLKFAPDSENDDEEAWLHEVAARQLRLLAAGQAASTGLESRSSALPSPSNRPATSPPRSAPPKPATSATQAPPSTRPAAPIRPANGQKR
jgi:hypothetical protein